MPQANNGTDAAYMRLRKAALRSRAVVQLTTAIKKDLESLPKTSDLARRSVKVLDYMRGYIEAVAQEEFEAREAYQEQAYATLRQMKLEAKRAARQAGE